MNLFSGQLVVSALIGRVVESELNVVASVSILVLNAIDFSRRHKPASPWLITGVSHYQRGASVLTRRFVFTQVGVVNVIDSVKLLVVFR